LGHSWLERRSGKPGRVRCVAESGSQLNELAARPRGERLMANYLAFINASNVLMSPRPKSIA